MLGNQQINPIYHFLCIDKKLRIASQCAYVNGRFLQSKRSSNHVEQIALFGITPFHSDGSKSIRRRSDKATVVPLNP